jgi:hypothetical protein
MPTGTLINQWVFHENRNNWWLNACLWDQSESGFGHNPTCEMIPMIVRFLVAFIRIALSPAEGAALALLSPAMISEIVV